MDGLLVDSEPVWHEVEIDVFARHGVPLTVERCLETKGMFLGDAVDHWYARYPWNGRVAPRSGRAEIVDAMAARLEPEWSSSRVRSMRSTSAQCEGRFWRWRRRRLAGSSTRWCAASASPTASPWCTPPRTRRWQAGSRHLRHHGPPSRRGPACLRGLRGLRRWRAGRQVRRHGVRGRARALARSHRHRLAGEYARADAVLGSLLELDDDLWGRLGARPAGSTPRPRPRPRPRLALSERAGPLERVASCRRRTPGSSRRSPPG